MISFIPDVNVWIALSDTTHIHNEAAMEWLRHVRPDSNILFFRYTQVGLIRLLNTPAVMGDGLMTVREAWGIYDFWVRDPRISMHLEPRGVDELFRETMEHFANRSAAKWVGDCYLLASAAACRGTLVTFDKGLIELGRKLGYRAMSPVQ